MALLFLISNKATAQKNLVLNNSFEDDADGWINYGGTITPYDFKDGKKSCAIVAYNTEKWVGLHQIIGIPKKAQAFEFSGWLKTINVIKGLDDWSGGIFNVEFLDRNDKKLGESVSIARITGDQEWQLVKTNVRIPAGAVSFKILIALGYASGTLFVDDVSAKVISPDAVGN